MTEDFDTALTRHFAAMYASLMQGKLMAMQESVSRCAVARGLGASDIRDMYGVIDANEAKGAALSETITALAEKLGDQLEVARDFVVLYAIRKAAHSHAHRLLAEDISKRLPDDLSQTASLQFTLRRKSYHNQSRLEKVLVQYGGLSKTQAASVVASYEHSVMELISRDDTQVSTPQPTAEHEDDLEPGVKLFIDRLDEHYADMLEIFEQGSIANDCHALRRALNTQQIDGSVLWPLIDRLGSKHRFIAPANDLSSDPNDAITAGARVLSVNPDMIAQCQHLKSILAASCDIRNAIMREYITLDADEWPGDLKAGRRTIKHILNDAGIGDTQALQITRRFENSIHEIADGIWDVPKR